MPTKYPTSEKTGSDNDDVKLLGHAGLKYLERYCHNTQAERNAILESVKVDGEW